MRVMTTKALVLRLPPDDFARLETEARKLGVRPGTAARILLRERLNTDAELRSRRMAAIEALGEISRRVQDFDAVRIVREGRDELEERGDRKRDG